MTEPQDPLEVKLAALRPHEVSSDLQRRIAERLSKASPSPFRWLWRITFASGLAAACLVTVFLLRKGGSEEVPDTRRAVVTPRSVPSPMPPEPINEAPPTLFDYQQALARSPEDLEALLDKQTARGLKSEPNDVSIYAFRRSQAGLDPWRGEP